MDKGSIFTLLQLGGKTSVVKEDYLRKNGDFEMSDEHMALSKEIL